MSTELDYAPVGIVDDRDTLLTTLRNGDLAATLVAVDTGPLTGGRWVIDGQSQAGLFRVEYNPAVDTSARLVVANAALLKEGTPISVTVHYYDHNQLDARGNPVAGLGYAETFVYAVEAGSTQDLARFGAEFALGTNGGAADPAMATLADGGFVTAWQSAGAQLWCQLSDAAGQASGAAFALTSAGGAVEGEPTVAALANGGFVVAYSARSEDNVRIAYRIVAADGSLGVEHLIDRLDAVMPDLAVLEDGSFALAWRAGAQVEVGRFSATGAPLGAIEQFGAFGSAYSPSVVAHGASFAVSWGEIGDGNVYVAQSGGAAAMVNSDGMAASDSTGAPLPGMTALADGGFVVAWDSYVNNPFGYASSDIFFQRYDAAGQAIGAITQVNTDSSIDGRFDAQVTALGNGGFVVAWHTGDFDGEGVYGRRFDAAGSALDVREFAINELRQGDQGGPALTALANGGFATAWVDTQADGATRIEARVLAGETLQVQAAPPVAGSAGADTFEASAGNQLIDGGGGRDTVVYEGARQQFNVSRDADGATVTDTLGAGGSDTLLHIERLAFDDVAVALDIDGSAGQAYRLYAAAFDRAPDDAGLGYWISAMDHGVGLQVVAGGFTASQEFADLYGAHTTDGEFVDLLYQNTLHRAPDADGRAFWIDALQIHHLAREQLLVQFSESPENQAQVIGSIQDGIDFTPWG